MIKRFNKSINKQSWMMRLEASLSAIKLSRAGTKWPITVKNATVIMSYSKNSTSTT